MSSGSGRRGRRGRAMTSARLEGGSRPKYTPLSSVPPEKIFDFVYLTDDKTVQYLRDHGRVVFVIRGPPGSRKEALCDLICKQYPSAVVCCAHDFFASPMPKLRTLETVKESHDRCAEKLKDYCKENTPVIVLKNTHIRKTELEEYVDIIRNHNYTMIISETPRKYRLAQESLAKTNRKGLSEEYLGKRMFQWDEFVPWFTGWFLNPSDSEWLFQKSLSILSLLEEQEECEASLGKSIKDRFCQESVLFCIAAYCNLGKTDEGRACYLNEEVQDYYGKMSELNIHSFIIKNNMIIAVVQLSPEQHNITLLDTDKAKLPTKLQPRDPLVDEMKSLKIQDDYSILNSTIDNIDKANSVVTFEVKEVHDEDPLLATCGFMLVARAKSLNSSPLFSDFTMLDGLYHYTSAEPKETISIDGKTVYEVDDAWFVKLNSYYTCKSVFTGLY